MFTAVSTKVARHGVTRVGGGGVLLERVSDTELRRGHDPVEAGGRTRDPLAVSAVAECLLETISTGVQPIVPGLV